MQFNLTSHCLKIHLHISSFGIYFRTKQSKEIENFFDWIVSTQSKNGRTKQSIEIENLFDWNVSTQSRNGDGIEVSDQKK